MGHATHMPQLHKDLSALGVHRFGDFAPASDLLGCVETGGVLVALRLCGDLSRFRNDQASGGALCVVSGRKFIRHQA